MLQQLCELVALKAATIWDAKLLDPHGNLSCASALQRHAQSRIACASAEARCTTGGHDASDADRPDSHVPTGLARLSVGSRPPHELPVPL
jgi:hypothetical protein